MEKNCKIIFCNKQEYEFNSKDLDKALEYCVGKCVWAFRTPWGVFQPMSAEEFDNISAFVFDGPVENENTDV